MIKRHPTPTPSFKRIALLVMALLYYTVPWGASAGVATALGLPLVIVLTIVAPGLTIARWFPERHDAVERIVWVCIYGLAFALAGAFAWALTGTGLRTFAFAMPLGVMALWLIGNRDADPAAAPVDAGAEQGGPAVPVAFAALAVILGALVVWSGPAVDFSKDTIDHAGYVNEIAATGDPFPNTAFYADPGPNGEDFRKGLLHALMGYYAGFLQLPALSVFRLLNGFFYVLLLFSVYAAARLMFGSRAVAALAGVFFIFGFEGGIGSHLTRAAFYPNRFGIAPMLLFTAAALDYVVKSHPKRRIACGLLAFAAAAAHIQFAVFIVIVGGVIKVWKGMFPAGSWRTHFRRVAQLGGATLAGLLPYAVYRFATAYQTNDLHTGVQGALMFTDHLFVADPLRTWHWMGGVGLAAVIAIPALWRERRREPGVGYAIASLLSVMIVQYIPFIMPLAYIPLKYLVYRIALICPIYMLAAYLAVRFFTPAPVGVPRPRLRVAAMIVLGLGVASGLAGAVRHSAFAPSRIAAERRVSHHRWDGGLAVLRDSLPAGTVIASDPITSYTIAAFTPHFVVATLDQHAPPNDLRMSERMRAARDILSPFTTVTRKAALMREHGADCVVVNRRLPPGQVLEYWSLEPDIIEATLRGLRVRPDVFREIPGGDGLVVFEWTGTVPAGLMDTRPAAVKDTAPPGARRVDALAGEARVVAVELPDGAVARGDSFEMSLYWSSSGGLPRDNYVVVLRFDRADTPLPFGGRPFPKVTRKVKEALAGERYRFRTEHKILDGFYDPDEWPDGAVVKDDTTERVPVDLTPGTYTVRAKLITRAPAPNHYARDFLFDNDMYNGTPVGTIEVR